LIAATPAHAAAMAAIHAAAFPTAERWNAEAFATQLALPGGFGFVDEAGGLILLRVAADEAEVLTLAVAPDIRRRGVGHGLLEAALAAAAAQGAVSLFLEVARSNVAARALYAAAGFAEAGLRHGYYPGGDDALVLRSDLLRRLKTEN